jgi:hypothetical protein
MGVTKILNHISFARDWLNRAEEKVRVGKMVEGELYLSLAEAEVRKAWETSYFSREKVKFRFPAVVTIALIFLFMVLGIFYYNNYFPREEAFKLNLTEGYEEVDVNQDLRLINVGLSISRK